MTSSPLHSYTHTFKGKVKQVNKAWKQSDPSTLVTAISTINSNCNKSNKKKILGAVEKAWCLRGLQEEDPPVRGLEFEDVLSLAVVAGSSSKSVVNPYCILQVHLRQIFIRLILILTIRGRQRKEWLKAKMKINDRETMAAFQNPTELPK